MNKEHKQKRYETEQQILDAIDKARKEADELDKQADEFERLKDEAANTSSDLESAGDYGAAEFWRDNMREYKKKCEQLRRRSANKREARVKELSDILAAFKTEVMPFMATDNSVAV